MLLKIIKNKILLSIIAITFLIIGTLFVYIPKITEQNTIDTIVRNSEIAVEQIKLTRAYYVNNVVKDIKKNAKNIKFGYDHKTKEDTLPFPTTVIHDLGKIFSNNTGLTFELYSEYPFKHKANRKLSESQKEALSYIKDHESGHWIKRDNINGQEVLRVAVADYMTQNACVSCHNSHKDRTWPQGYWKLGDKRGLLEVITPLDESLNANKLMRDKILIFIAISMALLLLYYSISLIRRETELLDMNEILDKKVKEEVAKNMQKEKALTLQNRNASMGEMMSAILHQWKQPLNAISLLNSSMSTLNKLEQLDKDDINDKTKKIQEQINNMASTSSDFGNFFKPQEKSVYCINHVIKNVIKLIGTIYNEQDVKISFSQKEMLETQGYENELSQVLINILNNARDVILEKKPENRTIFISTYSKDKKVYINIKDCAGGIDEKIIDKIFDVYFTTKKENNGTGIGLDMSKTIINKTNGKLSVINESTKIKNKEFLGASFLIELEHLEDS